MGISFNPLQTVKDLASAAKETVSNVADKVTDTVKSASDKVTDTVKSASGKVVDTFEKVSGAVSGAAQSLGDKAKAVGETVGNAVKATGEVVVDTAKAAGGAIVDGAKAVGGAIVDGAKAAGETVGNAVKAVGDVVVDTAKAAGGAIIDGAKAVGGTIVDGAKAVGETVGNAVKAVGDVVGTVVDTVKDIGNSIGDAVKTAKEVINSALNPPQITTAEWSEKMALAEQGLVSSDPKVREAAGELKQHLIAQQMSLLSSAVYEDPIQAPPGWKDISSDPEALKAYGLDPSDLNIEGSDFRARMFVPDGSVLGDSMKPTLAFKGTSTKEDWENNFRQGLNIHSDYYDRAVALGKQIEEAGASDSINITGHSLGGGLASAASVASGSDAYTFNAAGLNDATVSRYGGTDNNPNISAYQVKGEALTGLQSNVSIMPEARGTAIELPANPLTTLKGQLIGSAAGNLLGNVLGGPMGGAMLGTAASIAVPAVLHHLGDAFKGGINHKVLESEANLRKLME